MYSPHSVPGVTPAQYDGGADSSLFVAVQIESRSGVENVEAIAKVEGLDALLIGTSLQPTLVSFFFMIRSPHLLPLASPPLFTPISLTAVETKGADLHWRGVRSV